MWQQHHVTVRYTRFSNSFHPSAIIKTSDVTTAPLDDLQTVVLIQPSVIIQIHSYPDAGFRIWIRLDPHSIRAWIWNPNFRSRHLKLGLKSQNLLRVTLSLALSWQKNARLSHSSLALIQELLISFFAIFLNLTLLKSYHVECKLRLTFLTVHCKSIFENNPLLFSLAF